MNEEEFKKLEAKIGTSMAEKFSELSTEMTAGYLTEDQLKTELESFAKSEDIEGVNEMIDTKIEEVLVEVKKMQKLQEGNKPKSIGEQMEAFKDNLEAFAKKETKSLVMTLKTNVTTGSITDDNQGVSVPGFNLPGHRDMPILDLFRRVTLPAGHHGTVYYTDQTTTTRNAATRDEAAAAPESAIAWTRRSISMEKILDSIPMTWETMRYMPELIPEVENFINLNMMLEWENQLLTGDNSAPNWAGAYATYATDFTSTIAGTLGKVDDANLADLISKVSTYMSNGYKSKYKADFVILNPDDLDSIRHLKDANSNYLKVPFINDGMTQVRTMKIVESSLITANTMLIGDGRLVTAYDVDTIELEFGLDSDDFTKDLITLKGRKAGNLLRKTLDTRALYKVTNITERVANINA